MQSPAFGEFYCFPVVVAIRSEESLLLVGWHVGLFSKKFYNSWTKTFNNFIAKCAAVKFVNPWMEVYFFSKWRDVSTMVMPWERNALKAVVVSGWLHPRKIGQYANQGTGGVILFSIWFDLVLGVEPRNCYRLFKRVGYVETSLLRNLSKKKAGVKRMRPKKTIMILYYSS